MSSDPWSELLKVGILGPIIVLQAIAIKKLYDRNNMLEDNYKKDLKEINSKWAQPISAIRKMVEAMFNKQNGL